MSRVTVVDNEYITVEYLPDKAIIAHVIHQPIGGQILRDAMSIGAKALAEYGVTKWLSDDRKNGPLSPDDIEWGCRHWSRVAIESGWQYWAVVLPEHVVAAGSLAPCMHKLFEMGVGIVAFHNPDTAMRWIENQN